MNIVQRMPVVVPIRHEMGRTFLIAVMLFLLATALSAISSPAQAQWNDFETGDVVTLRSDTGAFMGRCNNCLPMVSSTYASSGGNAPMVHIYSRYSPFAQFRIIREGRGRIRLQSVDTGQYLARCNGCVRGAAKSDFLVFRSEPDIYGIFELVPMGEGYFGLRADNGLFVARCRGCAAGAAYPDSVTVHATSAEPGYAQWQIRRVNRRRDGWRDRPRRPVYGSGD